MVSGDRVVRQFRRKKKEERKDPILFKANDNLLIDILGHFHLNTSVCAPSLLFSQACELCLVDSRQYQGSYWSILFSTFNKYTFFFHSQYVSFLCMDYYLQVPASDMPYCKRKKTKQNKNILSLVPWEVFHISVPHCFDCLSQYGRQYVHKFTSVWGEGRVTRHLHWSKLLKRVS